MRLPNPQRRLWAVGLLLLAGHLLDVHRAAGQEIQADEKDFEGLTSLALGSGARAFGMGGAFLARADDATAASWNPAGLSYLRKPEVSLVGVRNAFTRDAPTTSPGALPATDRLLGYTGDFTAFTYPVAIGRLTGAVQLSYQRVFSFHGRRDIHQIDPGGDSPAAAFDMTSFGQGGFDVLSLGTGLQATRWLRIGVTVNDWLNGYEQFRTKTVVARQQIQSIQYKLSGLNANVGVIWSPLEQLNIGLVGKTAFTGNLDVFRRRIDIQSTVPVGDRTEMSPGFSQIPPVELHLPGAIGAGISWRPWSPLTLSADYTRSFWSQGEIRNFFLVPPAVPDVESKPVRVFPRLTYPSLEENVPQYDTQQFRTGAEYVIVRRAVRWPVRAGFFTDRQFFAAGDGTIPVFKGFTVGTGLGAGSVLFDVAYLRETGHFRDRIDPTRTVSTRFERVFLSVIYRHE